MMDILDDLIDLHKQAITERSHYYVASTSTHAIIEVQNLRARIEQLEAARSIPLTDEVIGYIGRYGGFCRDCADENGICPTSGLPCADRAKAIRHVITAYNYGVTNGFICVTSSLTKTDTKP